jgi:hypothetical protein
MPTMRRKGRQEGQKGTHTMKPGKYEVSYSEERLCFAIVTVSQDDIDTTESEDDAILRAMEAGIDPHDVVINDIELLDVLQGPIGEEPTP